VLYKKAGTFIYIFSIARMLAASMQCWRIVRALRSHGRCRLVVSSDEMSLYASRSQTSSVTDRQLITDLSTVPYDQKDLCIFCRTYTSVESWQQNTAGPLKRPSPSTIASRHDITGSSTSSYKVPQTSNSSATTTLRSFINMTSICRSKFFHYSVDSLYWLSSQDVII